MKTDRKCLIRKAVMEKNITKFEQVSKEELIDYIYEREHDLLMIQHGLDSMLIENLKQNQVE